MKRLPVVLVLFLSLSVVYAQSETARVTGRITDTTGAVIPGAECKITNIETNISTSTISNELGIYVLQNLRPGMYRLTISMAGFNAVTNPNFELHVQDAINESFVLSIGSVDQTVTVEGGAPLVNTESAAVGTVVDRQFVQGIPLNGRTLQSLIALTPGIVFTGAPTAQSGNGNSGGTGQFSVNGQRSDTNAFMVDGVSANFGTAPGSFLGTQAAGNLGGTTALGTTQSLASLDAIQEFRVQTSTYSAEYGRQPGAQISIVTRSGTNSFHGLLFEYLRNDIFDANDWFGNSSLRPRPPERQNDFGGTFGGPVILPGIYNGHDKTFFFFSYEGLRLRLPKFAITNVPTLCLRATGTCPAGQGVAPGGLLPMMNAFPLPNGKDLGNGLAEFNSSYSDPSALDATSIRIDHALSPKWNLFGRYNNVPSTGGVRGIFNLAILSRTLQTARTLTFGLTGMFSPRSSDELRVNFTDNPARSRFGFDTAYGATPIALSNILPSPFVTPTSSMSFALFFPNMTAAAGSAQVPLSGSEATNVQDQKQFNVVDNVSFALGSHQLRFGVDLRRVMPFSAVQTYAVSASYLSLASVLNNKPDVASIRASNPVKPIFTNWSGYGQDSWSVSGRLSLDLGLRWDVNPAPSESNGHLPIAVDEIANLSTMQLASYGTAPWRTTYANFAPRFGLAFQIRRTPGRETVFRGGFGVFYDTGNAQGVSGLSGPYQYPFVVSAIPASLAFPLSAATAAPPTLPDARNLTPPYGSIAVFDPHLKLPSTLQWSAAMQQSLGRDQALTLTYVGNHGARLIQQHQINLTKINPKFTIVGLTTNGATSDYHALQAQFQRRLSKGLQALASYSWSHAIDFDSTDNGSILPVRGNSFYDVRHNVSGAVTYEIPVHSASFINSAFGNWSVYTDVQARTALPVDISAAQVTNAADGTLAAQRPNLVSGQALYIYDSNLPGGRAINRGAFAIPQAGRFGNLGRNVLRGFGMWQQDLGLQRLFKLTEKLGLEFRAEAFNIYNHPNFGAIQTTLSAATFGQATGMLNSSLATGGSAGKLSPLYASGGPRSMQFALRLSF